MNSNITTFNNQVQAATRAEIDMQIATAKQWPRDEIRAVEKITAMVTGDIELALSCTYKLPRGKGITGPSVRLAEIIASSWGNLRVKYEIIDVNDKSVTARGTAHDLETNFAVQVDVSRSIVGKNGQKYSEDMIIVTGNAAGSIAMRNAIFKVVPKALVNKIEESAKKSLTEDKNSLPDKVEACLNLFSEIGVDENMILSHLKIESKEHIKGRHLGILSGVLASIQDGLMSVNEIFKKEEEKIESEPVLATKEQIDDFLSKCAQNEIEVDGEFLARVDSGEVSSVQLMDYLAEVL